MKANQKIRDNRKGITSTLGTILILPVVMMLISALIIWSQSVFREIDNSRTTLTDLEEEIKNNPVDINILISEGEVIFSDSFEYENQWTTFGADDPYFDFDNSEVFYSDGHSLKIKSDDAFRTVGVLKPFSEMNFGKVCIDISFTIHPKEKYKNFSIYEENDMNMGIISIDLINNEVSCYDGGAKEFICFEEDLTLSREEHSWHHMRLIVDFENDDFSSQSHYMGLILNDKYYSLNRYELKNPNNKGISSNTIFVSFNNYFRPNLPGRAVSCVDDFKLIDLNKV